MPCECSVVPKVGWRVKSWRARRQHSRRRQQLTPPALLLRPGDASQGRQAQPLRQGGDALGQPSGRGRAHRAPRPRGRVRLGARGLPAALWRPALPLSATGGVGAHGGARRWRYWCIMLRSIAACVPLATQGVL